MSTPKDRYHFSNEADIPPGVADVIRTLLKNWDRTDDATHAYLAAFTPDATLDLPPNKMLGHDNIRATRQSLIHHINGPVIGVAHTFHRLYVYAGHDGSKDGINVSMTGTVAYTVRGGKVAVQEFSTSFDLVAIRAGEYKIPAAKIYSDNAPLMAAMAEMPPQ